MQQIDAWDESKRVDDIKARNTMLKKLRAQNLQLFNNFRPFGFAFFKNEIEKPENIDLFDKKLIKIIESESWNIYAKDKNEVNKLRLIFKIMMEGQPISISYKGLYPMQEILSTISHVSFLQLTQLNLYQCGIVNIQPLSFIDAPNLKSLNLIYNYVYQYKSLTKANFKSLSKLFIYQKNLADFSKTLPFVNLGNSSRWDFSLQELRLEKHFYNKILMHDLSFLIKVKQPEGQSLSTFLSMHNGVRILQRKLCKKYYDSSNIKLILWRIYDQNEMPIEYYFNWKKFNSFHEKNQY